MSNLLARLMVAVVAVPAIVLLLYRVPAIGFFLFALTATGLTAWELFTLVAPNRLRTRWAGTLLTMLVSIAIYVGAHDPRVLVTVLVIVPLLGIIIPLVRVGDVGTEALRAATFSFGPLYVGAPLAMLALLQRDHDPGFVLCALGFAWLSDTMAYFVGTKLGRIKLYPMVSPNKTVEGALGGLLGAMMVGIWGSLHLLQGKLPIAHAVPLAVVAGALGQLGDLGESLLKRSTGVKHSSALLPGHGGLLDRLDATLFTSAVVYLYVVWTQH